MGERNTKQQGELKQLTPRQQRFVEEYLCDLNGTQAAIRAGYSPATANEQACDLLARAHIADAVARLKAERLASVNVSAESILRELDALARSNINHYVINDDGQVELAEGAPSNAMAAIQSIRKKTRVEVRDVDGVRTTTTYYDVELKLWDKTGTLKLMGKHAGVKACFDKLEVTGPGGGPLQIEEVRSVVVDPQAVTAHPTEGV